MVSSICFRYWLVMSRWHLKVGNHSIAANMLEASNIESSLLSGRTKHTSVMSGVKNSDTDTFGLDSTIC